PRGIDESAVLLCEACAWQPIDGSMNVLHLVFRDPRRLPEIACFFRIEIANDKEVGLLQSLDVLARVWTDGDAVHAKGEQAFNLAGVHLVPHLGPGKLAINLR